MENASSQRLLFEMCEMGAVEKVMAPVFLLFKLFGLHPEGSFCYKVFSISFVLGNLITAVFLIKNFLENNDRPYNSILDFNATVVCLLSCLRSLGSLYFVKFKKNSFNRLLSSINQLLNSKSKNCSCIESHVSKSLKQTFRRQIFIYLFEVLLILLYISEVTTLKLSSFNLAYCTLIYLITGQVIVVDLMFSSLACITKILIKSETIFIEVHIRSCS